MESAAVRCATRSSSSSFASCSASCALCRSAISFWSASFSVASDAGLAEQLDEHRDLRSQDVRVDRFAQVVDRADAVAAQDVFVVEQVGGQEEDGDVLRALPLLDQMRQLDAADARHPDVEDDRRKVLPQHREQRFVGRLRHARRGSPPPSSIASSASRLRGSSSTISSVTSSFSHDLIGDQRYSHTRSSDSSWSVLTGLAM